MFKRVSHRTVEFDTCVQDVVTPVLINYFAILTGGKSGSIIMGMKRKFVSRKTDSEEELDPMLLHEPEIKRPARQDISGCFFLKRALLNFSTE